ncbi:hypothetical protein K3495_g15625 [Podosphaera aphanis]|nr:hypothetical protein K3495_g15625 [Podosphaera aphanis]
MFNLVKAKFEGQEHKNNLLNEWNGITLRKMFLQYPEKPRTQILKEMVEKLQQIQYGLSVEFQSEASLTNKIKTACASVPSCSSAILIPTDTLAGLVNNLVTAISHDEIAKKENLTDPINSSAFFTDRKFHTMPKNYSKSEKSVQHPKKKCFVCKKEGCWSTRHTETERQFARRKFDNKISSYILEYEGKEGEEEEDPENDSSKETDIMFLELNDDDNINEEHHNSEFFITSIEKIPVKYARDFHETLCDCERLSRLTQRLKFRIMK